MDAQVRRELRILKGYAIVVTALLGTLSLAAFRQSSQKTRFTEIDVERINVVEKDGNLRMVISNRDRSIGPIYKGKPFGYPGGTRPGIIFFNDEGTENGGLTFTGKRQADGTYQASSGFSFDQFNQDQVLYLQYSDNNGRRNMGLTIADRADLDIYDLVTERDSIMKAIPEGPAQTAALQKWAAPRNGVPLATSVERYDVSVDQRVLCLYEQPVRHLDCGGSDPRVADGVERAVLALAPVLGMDTTTLRERLTGTRGFAYVKKGVTPEVWRAVSSLDVPGINGTRTSDRLYPAGSVATSVLPSPVFISEIFPNKVRGEATAVAVVSLWAAYFVLAFTFPILFEKLQEKSFYIYSAICVLGFFFVWRKVKETKGKTLEELENVMEGN